MGRHDRRCCHLSADQAHWYRITRSSPCGRAFSARVRHLRCAGLRQRHQPRDPKVACERSTHTGRSRADAFGQCSGALECRIWRIQRLVKLRPGDGGHRNLCRHASPVGAIRSGAMPRQRLRAAVGKHSVAGVQHKWSPGDASGSAQRVLRSQAPSSIP